MATRSTLALLGLALLGADALAISRPVVPRPRLRAHLRMQEEGETRVGVSGLAPPGGESQEQYVGVPPPGGEEMEAPPIAKSGFPVKQAFISFTFVATFAATAWQSNRMYKRRQKALIADFADTMLFHLGDEREMATAVSSFRKKLGPGQYLGPMFVSFAQGLASAVPVGVKSVEEMKRTVRLMNVPEKQLGALLAEAADGLQEQPSVLGKLCFVAERATPAAASAAKLRTKFPTWDEETVGIMQRAMVDDLYRKEIEKGEAPDGAWMQAVGLSEGDAARIRDDVQSEAAAKEAKAAEEAAEAERALRLEAAIKAASENKKIETIDDPDDPPGE